MLKGFRDFILRGNVVDLAVAVIIGAAFGKIITAFTTNIISPLIGAIVGQPDFSYLVLTLHGGKMATAAFSPQSSTSLFRHPWCTSCWCYR